MEVIKTQRKSGLSEKFDILLTEIILNRDVKNVELAAYRKKRCCLSYKA